MKAATNRLTPPAPASSTRAVDRASLPGLRVRAARLLERVPAEMRMLRDMSDEHRAKPAEASFGDDAAAVEHMLARELDARATTLEQAADELAWLAGLPTT